MFEDIAKNVHDRFENLGLVKNLEEKPVSSRSKSVYLDLSRTGVPGIGEDLYFPSDDELNGTNSIINAIEVVDNVVCAKSPRNPASDNLSANILSNGILVFSNEAREQILSVPLYSLIPRLNGNKLFLTRVKNQVWQNCHIYFNDVSSIGASNTIWLRVYYSHYKDIPKLQEIYGW
jgi:hypothetical protein